MDNVKDYLQKSKETAATYIYLSDEPTMTNSRVEAMGTGSHTSYVKIATGFQNAFVSFRRFTLSNMHDVRLKRITSLSKFT